MVSTEQKIVVILLIIIQVITYPAKWFNLIVGIFALYTSITLAYKSSGEDFYLIMACILAFLSGINLKMFFYPKKIEAKEVK